MQWGTTHACLIRPLACEPLEWSPLDRKPIIESMNLHIESYTLGQKCDRIWENPPYGIFRENRDRNIISTTLELSWSHIPDMKPLTCEREMTVCACMRPPYTTSARILGVGGAWRSIVDLTKQANVWRQKRQGYEVWQSLSADRSKRMPVSQFTHC